MSSSDLERVVHLIREGRLRALSPREWEVMLEWYEAQLSEEERAELIESERRYAAACRALADRIDKHLIGLLRRL